MCGGLLHCCVLEGGRDVCWWGIVVVGSEESFPDDPSHSHEVSGDPLSCTLPWPALVSPLPPGDWVGVVDGGEDLFLVSGSFTPLRNPPQSFIHQTHTD